MLAKRGGGWGVKKEGGKGWFSKHPQSKEKAASQLRAIEANKHRHEYDCSDPDSDGEMEREEYREAEAPPCGCQDIPEEATRKPYRLHRTAGGRVRIEYASMETDDAPLSSVADARKHLQRHAQCACDKEG